MAEAKEAWYANMSYSAYKNRPLFKWDGEKFRGSGLKYLTNRFQRTHSTKTTEFDAKAITAFNLKVELFAQKMFDEMVALGHKVTYEDVFSGNKLSASEKEARAKIEAKRAADRAKAKADRDAINKKNAADLAKRKAAREATRREKAIELAKKAGLKVA